MDLFVLRPSWGCSPDKLTINREVAAELVRIRLEKAFLAMVDFKSKHSGNDRHLERAAEWKELWTRVRSSDEGRAAPKMTLSELAKDVAEIKRQVGPWALSDPYYVPRYTSINAKGDGLYYLMSWLSCHKWQRATTKGSRSNSGAFSLAQYGVSGQHPEHEEEE